MYEAIGGYTMQNSERKISKSNLISVVLVLTIIIISVFLWSYLHKTSPVDVVKDIIPAAPTTPPRFLFSVERDSILSEPCDVAASADGRLYVADTGHKTVKVFDINGDYLFQFGTRGKGAGQFLAPAGIAVSGDRVYVADGLIMKVEIFDLSGKYIGALITRDVKNTYGAMRPVGLCVDGNNNVYLTDIFNHRVVKFGGTGQVALTFGKPGNGPGELYYPNDIAVDSEGYIYVSDSNNSRIQVFEQSGKPYKVYDSKSADLNINLSITRGVTVDSKGLLYIADAAQGRIFVVKLSKNKPEPLFSIDSSGENDPLKRPNGVTSYHNKFIVADTGNNRLVVYGY